MFSRQFSLPTCLLGLTILAGCIPQPVAKPTSSPTVAEAPPRVLVVDDSSLAAAIANTWKANTETDVDVANASHEKVAAAKRLPADILVFPTEMLGDLVQNQLIVPAPTDLIHDPAWNRQDVFEIARRQDIQWGRETYALPLGSPPLLLSYRSDLLQARKLQPPQTWQELAQLAQQLAEGDDKFPGQVLQLPLAEGEAVHTFLAYAAPYVCDGSQLAVLFDPQSMEPLLTQPPYVRALTELVSLARAGKTPPTAATADDIWQGMFAGKVALGITKMGKAGDKPPPQNEVAIDLSPLPGTLEYYRFSREEWTTRTTPGKATISGSSGTLVAVTADARKPTNAWNFAVWLTNGETSPRLVAQSSKLAPFRNSHQGSLGKLIDSRLSADAGKNYFALLQEGQKNPAIMILPRLPRWSHYLAALDAAVRAAVFDEVPPAEALKTAAGKWGEITLAAGTNRQRANHLTALEGATR